MNNLLLKILDDNNKVVGHSNFNDWLRKLTIILNSENAAYVLDTPLPEPPPSDAPSDEHSKYKKWKEDELKACSYMMASMSDELQRKCEKMKSANEIYLALQGLYRENSRIRQYELSSTLFRMKLKEGMSLEEHVMKMINILGQLHAMRIEMPDTLKVDLVLQSLPPSFTPFINNYHLNRIEMKLLDLLNEMQQFYDQKRKGKRQEVVSMTSSSKTKKKKPMKSQKNLGTKPKGKGFKKKVAPQANKSKENGQCF
ncbi:uncharacterized protein LOC116141606 [Pistacia vera]|uniref:uncharacterized protein LOC116141606 n=1 Tax=Pistacia vera TaxID=55513 RepID=UPI0012639988|nr:uncharacterized protein LOC116141606 [Pistacia vera]